MHISLAVLSLFFGFAARGGLLFVGVAALAFLPLLPGPLSASHPRSLPPLPPSGVWVRLPPAAGARPPGTRRPLTAQAVHFASAAACLPFVVAVLVWWSAFLSVGCPALGGRGARGRRPGGLSGRGAWRPGGRCASLSGLFSGLPKPPARRPRPRGVAALRGRGVCCASPLLPFPRHWQARDVKAWPFEGVALPGGAVPIPGGGSRALFPWSWCRRSAHPAKNYALRPLGAFPRAHFLSRTPGN